MSPDKSMDEEEVAHHPDIKKPNGLYCFMDVTRPCGPECMAFQMDRPDGSDYRGQQWANCMLLTNMHKGAKHLIVLAQGIGSIVKQQQDAARTGQVPPTIPGIGR